mgnify:CR=1 FL=1
MEERLQQARQKRYQALLKERMALTAEARHQAYLEGRKWYWAMRSIIREMHEAKCLTA